MRLVVETTLPRGCTSFRSTPQAVPSSFSMLPTQVSPIFCRRGKPMDANAGASDGYVHVKGRNPRRKAMHTFLGRVTFYCSSRSCWSMTCMSQQNVIKRFGLLCNVHTVRSATLHIIQVYRILLTRLEKSTSAGSRTHFSFLVDHALFCSMIKSNRM